MRKFYLLISFLLVVSTLFAQRTIKGKVIVDGKGMVDVVVSSGYQFTKTDKKGNFKLAINEGNKFVQITSPSGYLVESTNSIPRFYHHIIDSINTYNFFLHKNPKDETRHKLIVQTDIQVANTEELTIYKNKVLPDIKATLGLQQEHYTLGLDLGDIVGDNPQLFEPYIDVMHTLDLPFYRVIGNHDMNYWGRTFETSESRFQSYFGPTVYSFNKGNVHYVVLNNNFYIGRDYFYVGYIDENTFKWLERDLSYVPKGNTVFVMLHIPTQLTTKQTPFAYNSSVMGRTTINASPLYRLLEDYNAHILSGHTHQSFNIEHNKTLFEHNIAAASGSWWQLDLCTDGTPRGYRVFDIDSTNVSWYYKSVGKDKDYQFRLFRDDSGTVIANVWNYDPQWKVEYYEDGKYIGEMEQFEGIDPIVANLTKDRSRFKYSWIAASNTAHLFRIIPSENVKTLEVKVTDRFGNIYNELLNF